MIAVQDIHLLWLKWLSRATAVPYSAFPHSSLIALLFATRSSIRLLHRHIAHISVRIPSLCFNSGGLATSPALRQ